MYLYGLKIEELKDNKTNSAEEPEDKSSGGTDRVISLSGMYENYFLDYASYVILERAVPYIEDGLKPVQRRILHAIKAMDDGRFHKVANVIGQTMQFHPHGDASIGDALVQLGQKDLLIDCQGNWGDRRTGDRAAAARYIEARLTKFALEVAFNAKTTEWQMSYDGRKKEPIALPMKFPLLLAQGVEGIAVGLSTKILPHNFIELIKGSINILKDKRVQIFPDFPEGGSVDVSNYNQGKRGGKVRVRAKIEKVDKKTLAIREIPYSTTTTSIIDSIIKANDKGKIKIKKVTDNTAKEVEILIELASGISPEVTMDALYAFTNCEVSISPNACVIVDNKPHFMTVEEILKISTEHTKDLLRQELEIELQEALEKWHFASLEKVFIENRVYREIEECETWEDVISTIDRELKKYIETPNEKCTGGKPQYTMHRDITEDDIVRLTEIKIKRISKFNSFKADELIAGIEEGIKETRHHLENLTDYAIAYFENLLKKYSKGRERRTVLTQFDTIKAAQVVAKNCKLYINREDGFVGHGLKKDEFVCECADIDDIIVFRKDGKFMVTRISDKTFVGKNIIHVAVWKKGDKRTTYNLVYVDGKSGKSYVKRFHVNSITRDKEYDLTKGTPRSKIHYFSSNPNGESEILNIQLSQGCSARKKVFDFDCGDIDIKGRGSQGNTLTKYPVRKVTLKEVGKSTLGAQKIWMDEVSGRLNTKERGKYLGAFDTGKNILVVYNNGTYQLTDYELTNRYDVNSILYIRAFDPESIISAIYYEVEKKATYIKRFKIETTSLGQKFNFIGENPRSTLYFVTLSNHPKVTYKVKVKKTIEETELDLLEFIDVKGWKSLGNKLTESKPISVKEIIDESAIEEATSEDNTDKPTTETETTQPNSDEKAVEKPDSKLSIGSEVEFDIKPEEKKDPKKDKDDTDQPTLF